LVQAWGIQCAIPAHNHPFGLVGEEKMQKHQENTNDQMFIHLISNLIYGYIS
jgi:hypothetical protein